MTGHPLQSMKHIQSLDALRGLAVLAVLAFHCEYLPCGWIGVQLFFVLSGFLITGILVGQKSNPLKPFLARFYWRRTLRVWPLYLLYIGVFAGTFLLSGKPAAWAEQWPFLVTYTYNFWLPPKFNGLGFFDHLWSLSVEEQFYLVWPFVVFFAPMPVLRRLLIALLLAGPLIRVATAALLWPHLSPENVVKALYNSPFSHFDAFAAGALVAVLPAAWNERLRARSGQILGAISALVVLSGAATLLITRARGINELLSLGYAIHLPRLHQYLWGYTLLNLAGAALVFHLVNGTSPRALQNRALLYVGKISYGVYVWHLLVLQGFFYLWPDWKLHRLSPRGLAFFAAYLVCVLAIASLSFFGFEQFFLRFKDRFTPGRPNALSPADT